MRFQLSVNIRTYRPCVMLVRITWRSLNMHVFSAGFFSQPASTLYHPMPGGLYKQTRWKSSKGCSSTSVEIYRRPPYFKGGREGGGHLDKHRCSSTRNLSLDKPPPPPPPPRGTVSPQLRRYFRGVSLSKSDLIKTHSRDSSLKAASCW